MDNQENQYSYFYRDCQQIPPQKSKRMNTGMAFGLISAALMITGMLLPVIDFSKFNDIIDIKYNIVKLCKNVRLISPVWTGIPMGLWIGIILMAALSFVKIPQFRLVPFFIISAMIIIMVADMNNLIRWAMDTLNSKEVQSIIKQEFVIGRKEMLGSLQPGAYVFGIGLLTGFVSSFIKEKDKQ